MAGIDFTPEVEQAQADWQDRSNPEGRHGSHRYSLEDFGTRNAEVDARMSFVREAYGNRTSRVFGAYL